MKLRITLKNLNFQRELFHKIYVDIDKSSHMTNQIFEILDLERLSAGRTALCITLDHIYNNNPNCLTRLHKPQPVKACKTLYLGNNALQQLDVLKTSTQCSSTSVPKYDSVYKIINKTLTPMGARFLKKQLIEPTYDINVLNERYVHIDKVKSHVNTLSLHLNFNDIEKLFRKIDTCLINPLDFHIWYVNIKRGIDFYQYINPQIFGIVTYDPEPLQQLVNDIESTFEVDNLNKYLLNDMCGAIFKPGIHTEIDVLVTKSCMCTNFMDALATHLQTLLNRQLKMDTSAITIKVVSNDKDDHLILTTKRAQVLKNLLTSIDTIELDAGVSILTDSLTFRPIGKGNNTKICVHEMTQHSDTLASCLDELKIKNKKCFVEFLESIQSKFRTHMLDLIRHIAYWDFIYSGAQCALQYNYVRPIIDTAIDTAKSYVRVTNMRHPLVELISLSAYVPTSLKLGVEDQDCMLLFGLTIAPESQHSKSAPLGINIILAQIGYNVAATVFKYYPYQSLLTRISSNDNLFKGLSSFALEMSEIKAILKRSNENTLIIADEVCKGSEHKSSLIIVTSIIEMLAHNKTSTDYSDASARISYI